MSNFISTLVSSLTISSFFDVLTDIVAVIVVLFPIIFGFYLIRKFIKIHQWGGLDYEDLVEDKDKERWLKDHRF